MSNQKGENMQQEATDYSNARIIEWEEGGEAFVGARTSRRSGFQTVNAETQGHNEAGFLTELEAENVGARVVAEFPAPSLAEIVGDAPAFRANILEPRPGEEHLAGVFAYRDRSGGWRVVSESDGSPWSMVYTLETLGRLMLDPASVVPLVAREVVS